MQTVDGAGGAGGGGQFRKGSLPVLSEVSVESVRVWKCF